MNRKIKTMTLLLAGTIFGLTSCDGLGGESIYDLDKAGEIDEVKKEIIEKVGDILVYKIDMTSQEELETYINDISVVTSDEAAEGTLNRKLFKLNDEGEVSNTPIEEEFFVGLFKKNEPKKISEIDFAVIEKNFEAAKKLIPSKYIDYALNAYVIDFEDNKRADTFTINTLMEGENNHLEGNNLVSNYYEFNFEVDENGTVVILAD